METKDRTVPVSSPYPAAFGSAKPCTYLIAETIAGKCLWAFAVFSLGGLPRYGDSMLKIAIVDNVA